MYTTKNIAIGLLLSYVEDYTISMYAYKIDCIELYLMQHWIQELSMEWVQGILWFTVLKCNCTDTDKLSLNYDKCFVDHYSKASDVKQNSILFTLILRPKWGVYTSDVTCFK